MSKVYTFQSSYSHNGETWYRFNDSSGNSTELNTEQLSAMKKEGHIFNGISSPVPISANLHGCQIYTGQALLDYAVQWSKGKNNRYAVAKIVSNLENYVVGKVCVVKGIRRTGKTTALLQAVIALTQSGISPDNISYMVITEDANTESVIQYMEECGSEYVFVDEVTRLPNLLNKLKRVSDIIAVPKKIVLAGTDSYVWPLAVTDVLYGRTIPIDLTFFSLEEYCSVFPDRVKNLSGDEIVSQFRVSGGVLDHGEYAGIEQAWISLQSALVENIQNTLYRNKEHPSIRKAADVLYGIPKETVAEAIVCAVLTVCNTQNEAAFTTKGVTVPELAADIVGKVGAYKAVGIKQDVLDFLLQALRELNVIDRLPNLAMKSETVKPEGMAVLVCHLSSLYSTIIGATGQKPEVIGTALENLVRSQCVQYIRSLQEIWRSSLNPNTVEIGYCRYEAKEESNRKPEADIVVRYKDIDGNVEKCYIIEIKRTAAKASTAKNLRLPSMAEALGRIDKSIVVYSGTTDESGEVIYVNIYDFLINLGKWIDK